MQVVDEGAHEAKNQIPPSSTLVATPLLPCSPTASIMSRLVVSVVFCHSMADVMPRPMRVSCDHRAGAGTVKASVGGTPSASETPIG